MGCGFFEVLYINMVFFFMEVVVVFLGYSVIVGFVFVNIEEMRINTKLKFIGIYWVIFRSFLYKKFCKIFK